LLIVEVQGGAGMRSSVAWISLVLALSAGTAHATPIAFTFSGDASGTFGTTAFSGPFSLVLSGDTSSVVTFGGSKCLSGKKLNLMNRL
jgi:hypothetical protein